MSERQPNSGTVTCKDALLIVFGMVGANGIYVLKLVEEECKEERVGF